MKSALWILYIKGSEGVIFKSRNRGWRALGLQIGKKVYGYNTMVREGCILKQWY